VDGKVPHRPEGYNRNDDGHVHGMDNGDGEGYDGCRGNGIAEGIGDGGKERMERRRDDDDDGNGVGDKNGDARRADDGYRADGRDDSDGSECRYDDDGDDDKSDDGEADADGDEDGEQRRGMPAVVHMHAPGLCLPADVFEGILGEIRRVTGWGLFRSGRTESEAVVRGLIPLLPSIIVEIASVDDERGTQGAGSCFVKIPPTMYIRAIPGGAPARGTDRMEPAGTAGAPDRRHEASRSSSSTPPPLVYDAASSAASVRTGGTGRSRGGRSLTSGRGRESAKYQNGEERRKKKKSEKKEKNMQNRTEKRSGHEVDGRNTQADYEADDSGVQAKLMMAPLRYESDEPECVVLGNLVFRACTGFGFSQTRHEAWLW
jgi:hypothetical protein